MWSYREDWCQAARAEREPGSDCFAPRPLEPAADGSLEELELADLIRFLRLPAEWFLTRTLGLRTPDQEAALEEVEPFVLDGLAGWGLRQRLLALRGRTVRSDEARALVQASGVLPHGAAAELLLDGQAARVTAFRDGLAPYLTIPRPPLELDLVIGGVRLLGWIDGVTRDGLLAYRLGRCRAQDLLALWVRHLALNCLAPAGLPTRSTLMTEEKNKSQDYALTALVLNPVPDATDRLAELIAIFQAGQMEPLPLFPETSAAFAQLGWDTKTKTAWEGGFNREGESLQWAIRTAFRGREPLNGDFERLAGRVFGPLFGSINADVQ